MPRLVLEAVTMGFRGSSVLSYIACPHALPEGEKGGWEILEVGLNPVAYREERESLSYKLLYHGLNDLRPKKTAQVVGLKMEFTKY